MITIITIMRRTTDEYCPNSTSSFIYYFYTGNLSDSFNFNNTKINYTSIVIYTK